MTQETERIVRPVYWGRRRYQDLFGASRWKHWAKHGSADDSWFLKWVEVDALLTRSPRPAIIGYALLAHAGARTRQFLEFSIPEFVRAAEGVLALAKGMGAKVFRDRALRLVPELRDDEYVGGDVDQLLLELYQLRSDCVHGKLPFADLQALGDRGQDRAAELSYVAEFLAREALLAALRQEDWSIFVNREDLEAAWAASTFPVVSVGTVP